MAQQIQLRRGTASAWTSANPILADGEIGIETDTGLYKVGNGVNTWTARPYSTLRNIDTGTVINMSNQATPSTPAFSTLNFFAQDIVGGTRLVQQDSNGISNIIQPSFAQKNIAIALTAATTSISSFGQTSSAVGSVTHPIATETYGYMANFATAASGNATSGAGNQTGWCRGSIAGFGGFFYVTRLALPDSSYNETGASTGSRIFVGLTDQTIVASVATDTPAGNLCGFYRRSVNGGAIDTNWLFATKDGTNFSSQDTGMVFTPQKVYDFYFYCSANGSTIYWQIVNITDNTSVSGSTSTSLPTGTVFMRGGFQLLTVNAVARNIRMQRMYLESNR